MYIIFLLLAIVLSLILLISWLKVSPFIAFILVSILSGFALKMPLPFIAKSIQSGIGEMMGSILVVICMGAMIGKLVAETGAAKVIADRIVKVFGLKYIQWGMLCTGFIIGIPLFYNVGFVVVIPIIFSIVFQYRISPILVGLPMLASLSAAHAFLPPHPSPMALVSLFHANMGRTLLLGVICAIPSIVIAGPLLVKRMKLKAVDYANLPFQQEQVHTNTPSLSKSIIASLFPVFIVILTNGIIYFFASQTSLVRIMQFIAEPTVLMSISLIVATYLLGISEGKSMQAIMQVYEAGIKDIFTIILIIGCSGALKGILVGSGVGEQIGLLFNNLQIHPLVLAWFIAATIRVSLGSATVAGLTTAGIIAPIMGQVTVDPSLMVLAIGAGSIMFSHVNDSGFWMYKEYFKLSIKETFLTWTLMETVLSITGFICVLVLSYLLPLFH